MSSFRFSVLILTMFICKQDSAIIRHVDLDQHKRVKGTGLEYVVHKYLNPLRRLTAELPNHAIELQIEILDQVPSSSPVPVPQRRVIRVLNRHPKKIARNNDVSSTPALLKQGPELSTDTTAASPADGAASTTADASTTAVASSNDAQNKPVYMEDLQKALTDLEKRLEQKQATQAGGVTPCGGGAVQRQNNNPPIHNIDDILAILKKAIHIEKHIPKPSDDNLEWVQIKIPKN